MKGKQQKQDMRAFLRFLKRAKLPWQWYILYMILSLALGGVSVKMMELTGEIMNGNFDRGVVVSYSLMQLGMLMINLAVSVFMGWIGYNLARVLQHYIWKRFIRLPMWELDKLNPSSLPSRITSDIANVDYTISYCIQMVTFTYQLALMVISVWNMNNKLALILLAVIPCAIIASFITGRLSYKVNDRTQTAYSRLMNYVTEGLSNLQLIKASASEQQEEARGSAAARESYKASLYGAKVTLVSAPLRYSVSAIAKALILGYGGILVSRGELEIGNLVTIFLFLDSIGLLVLQFVLCWESIKKSQGATAKVAMLMDIPSEELKREASFNVPDEDIHFQDVSFSYGGKDVLHSATFTIPKGKTTAIVGPSGSGKTTILSLLERFYQPKSGEIMFGQAPAERYHLDEWRKAFGYVPQSSPLLSGTIRENLCYGLDREATDADLIRAAKLANIYDFIQSLPQGFDTPVGQIGGRLSGGERQRMAIARTAIMNPDYLLLDEATSNLDPQNAAEVQAALNNLMKGRTCVIVAHSMHIVAAADHIVVVNQGQVEAEGTHEELYRSNELYHRCCNLQMCQ